MLLDIVTSLRAPIQVCRGFFNRGVYGVWTKLEWLELCWCPADSKKFYSKKYLFLLYNKSGSPECEFATLEGQRSAYFMPGQSVDNYGKGSAGIGVRTGAETGALELEQKESARKVPVSCQRKAQPAMEKVELVLQLDLERRGRKVHIFISEQSIFDYGKGGVGTGIKPRAEAASAVGTAAIAEGMGQKSVYFIPGQGTGTELQLQLGQGMGNRKLSISAWSKFLDW
ncbi:hypothetical protein DINM_000061 [Dirofilaria immitis]|nr:hypothetical protein [Dirofilaria immitis]